MTRVLFIGGAGRSGTTLFERVAARSGDATALGEVMHLWQRGVAENQLCGCGRPFHDCPFWTAVGERAFGGWQQVDPDRMRRLHDRVDKARNIPWLATPAHSRSFTSAALEYGRMFRRLYDAAAAVAGTPVVIDSSKQVSLPFVLRLERGLDLRVAQVVRDPRGVAHSWTKEVARPEITSGTVLMPRYSPRRTAVTWLVHNGGFDVLRTTGVPVRRLDYERFVESPADVMTEMAAFAGLTFAPDVLAQLRSGAVRLEEDHTSAGNPMRMHTGPLRFRHDDAWQSALPGGDRRTVERWTWPLRRWYARDGVSSTATCGARRRAPDGRRRRP